MNWSEFTALLPVFFPLLAAFVILLIAGKGRQGPNPLPPGVALLGLMASALTVLLQWGGAKGAEEILHGAVRPDRFALFLQFLVVICSGGTVLLSVDYLKRQGKNHAEFYALVLMVASGMMIMSMATDLIALLFGLEIMSIGLYVLVGFFREDSRSIEASIKYYLTGSFATGLYLFGAAMVFGATGELGLKALGAELGGENAALAKLGTGFLVAAFAFKVAAAPFHMWLPDVYDGAPTTVTGFMATGVKISAFGALVRVFAEVYQHDNESLRNVLWWIAVLTMSVGNVAALYQKSVKRMLAYSAIAHAGYLLIGIVAMSGIPSEDGRLLFSESLAIRGILYYLLAYAIASLGAFGVLAGLERRTGRGVDYEDLQGLRHTHPLESFALAVFMLSLAGLPGTAGFIGKFMVFGSAIEFAGITDDHSFYMLAILGILNSLVGLYYYLRVPIELYAKPLPEDGERIEKIRNGPAFRPVIVVVTVLTLWLGFGPGIFGIGVEPTLEAVMGALQSLR